MNLKPLCRRQVLLNIGDKVTLHTDGLQVTATTTSGVAEIVNLIETAVGGKVIVKF